MKRMTWSVLAIVLVTLTTIASAAADISGKWTASVETPMGEIAYTYDYVVKDSLLTGKIQSSMGSSEVLEGKVEGDKVSFVEILKLEGMELRITYAGQISSPDEIKFTRQVGDVATEQLVARRAKS